MADRLSDRCRHLLGHTGFAAALLLAFMVPVPPVHAQEKLVPLPPTDQSAKPDTATDVEALTAEIVESRRKEAETASDLDDETKTKIAELYGRAAEALKRVDELDRRIAAFQKDVENIQGRKDEIEKRKAELVNKQPALPENQSLADLEGELAKVRPQIAEFKKAEAIAKAEGTARSNRRNDAPKLIEAANQQLQETQQQLDEPAPQDESPFLTLARRTELTARRMVQEKEEPALRNEIAKYEAEDTVGLVGLQSDLATQEAAYADRELKLYETRIKELRERAAAESLRQAQIDVINAQPLIRVHAERNQELAKESQVLTKLIEKSGKDGETAQAQLDELRQKYTQIQDRVKSIGLTGSVGTLLRIHKENLPEVRQLRQNIRSRRVTLDDARYELFELEEERAELATPGKIIADILAESPAGLGTDEREELQSAAETTLERKREYLDSLIRNFNVYLGELATLDVAEQQLANLSVEFSEYVDERVFWIRSAKPLSSGISISDADTWIVSWAKWSTVFNRVGSDIRENLDLFAAALIVFVILFVLGRRFRHEIAAMGPLAARHTCTDFRLTLRATAMTVVIAAIWPTLTVYVSWRLSNAAEGDNFVGAVAIGLWIQACAFFPIEVLRQICRHNGLAESHFNWTTLAVQTLRRDLRGLMMISMPLVFLTTVLQASEPGYSYDAAERISFMLGAIVLAVFLARVLRPSRGVLREYLRYHPDSWADRLRHVWYWGVVVSPLFLAALAFWGFEYTALALTWRLFLSFVLSSIFVVVRALLLRWLLVQRRRLSIQQARERRAAALAAAETVSEAGATTQPVTAVEETADLAQLSHQTERFVTLLVLVAVVIGLWVVWSDVLPALSFLDQGRVWTKKVEVTETVTDSEGRSSSVTREIIEDVTYFDVVLALLIGVVTVIAFRNIPGLLEITVLQRLPIEPSVRYAVTTIASYIIVVIGAFVAARAIGLRWTQIQWLATALTFGLAFGLQEMFANFVAGLIILFERPLRVGDIVTVGDVTGVVSRVRIRATTITDWDRKEFVVPNKEFITGRLLNWTLSDKINRIVIQIGIAYGSDTEKARTLLFEILKAHPLLMDNPGPIVTFEGFGDSALNVVVRAYLPNMDNRLSTIHELHTEIHRRFGEAGIEIAFPQMDLHVRAIDLSNLPD